MFIVEYHAFLKRLLLHLKIVTTPLSNVMTGFLIYPQVSKPPSTGPGTKIQSRRVPGSPQAPLPVFFGSVKGARNAEFTLHTPKPQDAKEIENLHSLVLMIANPNRTYGVPLEWARERAAWWLTEGLEVCRQNIIKAHEAPEKNFWRVAKNKKGRIIGFVESCETAENKALLKALYVHPDFHGSKVAGQLVQESLQWAIRNRFKTIELFVSPYNPAIAFYRSFGFEFVPDSFTIFDGVMPLTRMSLDLSQTESQDSRAMTSSFDESESTAARFIQKVRGWLSNFKHNKSIDSQRKEILTAATK